MDDNALMRAGLGATIETASDIVVVASCDGPAALVAVIEHRPDVVLLDIEMPEVDGITVLKRLRSLPTPPVVAMLTAFGQDEYVSAALSSGADAYLLKDIDPEELIRQVRALGQGHRLLAPAVTSTVIDGYLTGACSHKAERSAVEGLTPRERETLSLLGHGLSNPQIARRMRIAPSTAKDYVSALLAKLGRVNRVQAAVLAERASLLTEPRTSSEPQDMAVRR
ncbi:response regulator [Streptomyces sp. NPDC058613]|uniref:response regulator n=1 Tax=unclassified Streptomyces TaxID=2593676 RepID=UPI003666CDFB